MLPTLQGEGALDSLVVGRKAAFLRDAATRGCPVPAGFIIPVGVVPTPAALSEALASLEARTGTRLFDAEAPLVLAVRSSGARSMPGELETVLGLGARLASLAQLGARVGGRAQALVLVRDGLRSFRRVVRGVRHATIAPPRTLPPRAGVTLPPPDASLEREIGELEALAQVPDDPREALALAIESVARIGRERAREPIAVVVQAMVLGGGSSGEGPDVSGSAVVLSRHALSGLPGPVGEWAPRMAGDALTSGRVVSPAAVSARDAGKREATSLERAAPDAYAVVARWASLLERAHRDAVELEVTIEQGTPHLIQVRPAKVVSRALVRVVVALEEAGILSRDEALLRVTPEDLDAAGTSSLPDSAAASVIAIGLTASVGVASGRVIIDVDAASPDAAARLDPYVLVRSDASAEDAPAVRAAAAVVTSSGGLTSHAAVMCRTLGRPCVVSASSVSVDEARGVITTPAGPLHVGDWVTVDGGGARLLRGRHTPRWSADVEEAATLLGWARERAPDADAAPAALLRAARAIAGGS